MADLATRPGYWLQVRFANRRVAHRLRRDGRLAHVGLLSSSNRFPVALKGRTNVSYWKSNRAQMNIAGFLVRSAHQHDTVCAVEFQDDVLTYGELCARARQIAGGLLSLGLQPGDRVAVLEANGPRLVETLFGIWMAGLIAVPINYRSHAIEAAYIVRHASAAAIVHGSHFDETLPVALAAEGQMTIRIASEATPDAISYERLAAGAQPMLEPATRRADDTAWIFYTSGTTGRPKGAMLSHRNLRQMVLNHLADVRPFQPRERVLHAAPLTHGSGLVMLACVARAASNVIYGGSSFDAEDVLATIDRKSIESIAFLAPTQIVMLNRSTRRAAERLSTLESVCYGGAPMFGEDLHRALARFGPIFVQIYGQGESPMTITALSASDHESLNAEDDPRLLSAGLPRTDVEIRVVDQCQPVPPGTRGEVQVRGDVVMKGYWNDDDATNSALAQGWLSTGDIGVVDDDGYLFILDRSKDLIISGGNNIYPREVEEAILRHPEVHAVAVIGIDDAFWGESVHAIVVGEPGSNLTARDVIAKCRERLASYKKPRTVEFVDQLPVNAYGKVDKRDLRNRHDAVGGTSCPADNSSQQA